MTDNLQPLQFSSEDRLTQYRRTPSIPGSQVFFGQHGDRYTANPFSSHIPPPVVEHGEDEYGPYTKNIPQHGIPGYDRSAYVDRPRRIEQVPVDRLESLQQHVSRDRVNRMSRRKGSPPPIEVTHHTEVDRYEISEGNHRAVLALRRGQTHIPAEVTRITPYRVPGER